MRSAHKAEWYQRHTNKHKHALQTNGNFHTNSPMRLLPHQISATKGVAEIQRKRVLVASELPFALHHSSEINIPLLERGTHVLN
jgi:hypothetical protein